jgi:hypothetical protein
VRPQRSRLVHSLQSHSDFTSSRSPASPLPSSNLHAFGPRIPYPQRPRGPAEAPNDLTLDVFRQRGSWKLDREPGAVRMRTPTTLVSARVGEWARRHDGKCCRGSALLRPVGVSVPSSKSQPYPLSFKPFPLWTSGLQGCTHWLLGLSSRRDLIRGVRVDTGQLSLPSGVQRAYRVFEMSFPSLVASLQ